MVKSMVEKIYDWFLPNTETTDYPPFQIFDGSTVDLPLYRYTMLS